ncbi:hypothetical protein BE20_01470 [Sorangium cellulosum]|nr:hypothetical protein BE20_01470 [Sorangium cellulosum]
MRFALLPGCQLLGGWVVLLVLALGALVGCSGAGEPSQGPSEALRARFPEQATQVLTAGAGFVATGQGFMARSRGEVPGRFRPAGEAIEAVLPVRGEEGLRFRGHRGFAFAVREFGAAGDAALEGSAVTYARAGGRSYWTAMADGGAEEWLLLEAEHVTSDAPVAVWEVDGAALRQEGEAVVVLDESGRARMRVTAPEAHAAGGRAIAARLAARGQRIELWVQTSGEAVLVDPVWQATGGMGAARSDTATLLPNGQVLVAGGYAPGVYPLASAELYTPPAMITPRRCCRADRCSSRAATPPVVHLSRARSCTTRRPERGNPPARWAPPAMITPRRRCRAGRCSSRAVVAAVPQARSCTTRRRKRGYPPA